MDPQTTTTRTSHYSAISGTNTTSDYIDLHDVLYGDIYTNGIFFPDSNTRIAQISDGTSNTLAIGERTYFIFHAWLSGATWYGITPPPGRIPTLSDFPPTAGIAMGGENNIIFPINADHNTYGYYKFDFSVPPDQRKMRLNELPFASRHPGGAHFGYADGSVHFLNETINFTTLQALATKDGGEVVDELP